MTLSDILAARIAATGPMTIADYMAECLLHPEHGYYATRDPFGAAGDFVTAPEVSQMFGELLGLCLAQTWMDQGQPDRFVLAELGPGRGSLMADALRSTKGVPGFHHVMEVHFVEASPVLKEMQRAAVPNAQFCETVNDLPDGPLFLIANEFFDALPIRQFVRAENGWRERVVGFDQKLKIGLTQPAPVSMLDHRLKDTTTDDVVEVCPALAPIVTEISARIDRAGGAALIIDYGDWTSLGDTLQALRGHESVDPLKEPGSADLTAHVDFAAIAAASNCAFSRLTPQGVFLERLGITARAQALAANLQDEALEAHISAHRRLTHPDEMGNLFKVMGLFPSAAMPPPGLQP